MSNTSNIYQNITTFGSNLNQEIIGSTSIIDLHRAINRLANKIDDASGALDSVTSAIVNSAEFIDDRVVDGVLAIDATHSPVVVDHEDLYVLKQQLWQLIADGQQVNFTDIEGNVYSILRQGDEFYIKTINQYKFLDTSDDTIDLLIESVDASNKIWLSDLFSQIAESQTLNYVISTASRMLNSASFSVSNFTSQIGNKCGNVNGAVANLVSQISEAFTASGFAGAAGILIQYAKAAANMTTSVENKAEFSFSDNSTLVPQEYIVGMIPGIISTVSGAVGLIAAAFNPIVGAVIMGAGWLASAIVNHFITDYDKTLCQYISENANDDEFSQIDAFPHGFFRNVKRTYISDISAFPEIELLLERSPLMFDVPGGYIFVSATRIVERTANIALQYEFHPSIHWHYMYKNTNYCEWAIQNLTIDGVTGVFKRAYARFNPYQVRLDMISGLDKVSPTVYKIAPINIMDEGRDKLLRIIFMHNVGLFLLWAFLTGTSSGLADASWRMPGFIIDTSNNQVHPEKNAAYSFGDYCISCAIMDYNWINDNYSKLLNSQLWTWTELANFAGLDQYGSLNMSSFTHYNHIDSVPSSTALSSAWNNPSSFTFGAWDTVIPEDLWLRPFSTAYAGYMSYPKHIEYSIQTPKYNRSTFFLWIAVVAAATAVAIAATVGITLWGRKTLRRMRMKRIANVENSWNQYVKTGDQADLINYEKAVKKNNKLASVIGGTKYSKEGYWLSTESNDEADNRLNINRLYNMMSGNRNDATSLLTIKQIITG